MNPFGIYCSSEYYSRIYSLYFTYFYFFTFTSLVYYHYIYVSFSFLYDDFFLSFESYHLTYSLYTFIIWIIHLFMVIMSPLHFFCYIFSYLFLLFFHFSPHFILFFCPLFLYLLTMGVPTLYSSLSNRCSDLIRLVFSCFVSSQISLITCPKHFEYICGFHSYVSQLWVSN